MAYSIFLRVALVSLFVIAVGFLFIAVLNVAGIVWASLLVSAISFSVMGVLIAIIKDASVGDG